MPAEARGTLAAAAAELAVPAADELARLVRRDVAAGVVLDAVAIERVRLQRTRPRRPGWARPCSRPRGRRGPCETRGRRSRGPRALATAESAGLVSSPMVRARPSTPRGRCGRSRACGRHQGRLPLRRATGRSLMPSPMMMTDFNPRTTFRSAVPDVLKRGSPSHLLVGLGAVVQTLQARRQRWVDADQGAHFLGELGRVRGLQRDSDGVVVLGCAARKCSRPAQPTAPCGFEDDAVLAIRPSRWSRGSRRRRSTRVQNPGAWRPCREPTIIWPDLVEVAAVELDDRARGSRVAHVHGVGDALAEGTIFS